MDRLRLSATATLALTALTLLTACRGDNRPLAPVAAENEVIGTVCAPLKRHQSASFAWETVTNTSDSDLEVTDVRLGDVEVVAGADSGPNDDTLRVTEWFLIVEDWARAGVRAGPLKEPGEALLPTTVAPGEKVLVGITVSGEAVEVPHTAIPRIIYTQDDSEHQVALSWRVKVVPVGQVCDSANDGSGDLSGARAR